VTDARNGNLEKASTPYLRDAHGLTNRQAKLVQAALIEEGLAMVAPGNRTVLT